MAAHTTLDSSVGSHIVRSTIVNYCAQFVTLSIGLFLTPFILHQLGVGAYGLWALVGSVVAYGSLLDFGIASAVTKYVAEYRARGEMTQARSLIATALWLYCGLGLLAVMLSAVIAPIFPDLFHVPPADHETAIWLVFLSGVSIGISIPCAMPWAVLRGLHRFDLISIIQVTGTLAVSFATVLVLLLGGGVLGMVAVNIPLTLIMQVPSIRFIHRSAPELHFGLRGAKRSLVWTVFSFSSSLFIIQIAARLQNKTDEIVIGAFLPVAAITPYAIARRLSEMAQILTDQFMKVLLPLASELHAENDLTRLRALYLTGTRLTLAIFLPIGCMFVILPQQILSAWVGAAYADQAHLVVILTFASLIVTSQWPAASILQGMARHRLLAVMAFASGVANLILSLALVQPFGLTGVALGTLIPFAVECMLFVFPYALRVIGVSAVQAVKEAFLPTFLPVIPTALVFYVLGQAFEPSSWPALLVVGGSGWLVYMLGYLRIGSSDFERQSYRSFVRNTIHFAQLHLKRP